MTGHPPGTAEPADGPWPDQRVIFTEGPTPVQRLDRLADRLGKPAGTLWAKRDDLTGLAAGGNKVRKLEYVAAQALAAGADWLVTGAGVQSNAARVTAAAAARCGLGCTLVLDGAPPARATGNLALDHLLGAEVVFCDSSSHDGLEEAILAEADRLTLAGRKPYAVPVGASTPVGSLGYVRAADELRAQLPDLDVVVLATGSAGTQAGLVAGFGDHERVLGIRTGTRSDLRGRIERLAVATAELAGRARPLGACRLHDGHLGTGYGAHTAEAEAALLLAARTEALVLDPVYTAKAMAGLIASCANGILAREAVVVFLHTGGMPGLLADGHLGQVLDALPDR